MITVKELIEKLQKMPQSAPVIVYGRVKSFVATDLHTVDKNIVKVVDESEETDQVVIYI